MVRLALYAACRGRVTREPADDGPRAVLPADLQAADGHRRAGAGADRRPEGQRRAPGRLQRRHDVRTRLVDGFPCTTVAPRGRTAERAVVYLHGGAYISAIAPQHWALVSRMADAGVRVEVPHYGLAPQYTHREAYPFVTAVYRELLQDVDAPAVTLAGDSAGGGLALGLAQTLADADADADAAPAPAPSCRSRAGSCCSPRGWTSPSATPTSPPPRRMTRGWPASGCAWRGRRGPAATTPPSPGSAR